MAGLLDALTTDDARFGIGLLAAAGPSPLGFGQRLQSALGSFDDYKFGQKKLGLLDAQLENYKSEAATRQAALAQKQAILGLLSPVPAAPAQVQPGQLGSGSFGIVPPPAGQPAIPQSAGPTGTAGVGGVGALTPDKLAYLKLLGVDLTDVYKLTQPDWQVSNGFAYNKNDPNFKGGFLPQVNVSQNGQATLVQPDANGGVSVAMPKGSLESYTAFRQADETAKAGSDLVKIVTPDGAERWVSRAQVLGGQQPATAPASATTRPTALTQPGDADRAAIFDQEMRAAQGRLANAKTPEERNRAQTDIAALEREIRALPRSAQPPGFQASPTTAQALSREAGKTVNDSFMKARYEPVLAAGDAAGDLLTSVQVARDALRGMGGSGWGTEAKALAANVLSGLGIKGGNSEMFAANVQKFQNAAMTQLKTSLDAAKGPQTEGDAARASKIFAQLGNTTEANEYILDLAEARAARDQMKSKFFQQALPIAQQKGDLAEIEREWNKRAPSVFSMPSMQRWSAKK